MADAATIVLHRFAADNAFLGEFAKVPNKSGRSASGAGGATDRRPTVPCFSRRLATMPDFFAASTNSCSA